MNGFRRRVSALLAAVLLLTGCGAAGAEKKQNWQISKESNDAFVDLLARMKQSCAAPSDGDEEGLDALVAEISAVNPDDGDVARAIAEHWKQVYLDPGYRLCVWWGREKAAELAATHPDFGERHAFVVLGYQLKNGKMQDELKARCDAAAAAARSFPDSWLICSGGPTGSNNPDRKTEAGVMKQYLVSKCGIAAERILTDPRAMSTKANAENTFAILRKKDIHTITLVTSAYHQKWGQVLYNAMAAIYEKRYGFSARIVGNFCCDYEPEKESFREGYGIALSQLSDLLGLKKKKKK